MLICRRPTVLLCDPPCNDADANWRMSVTIEEGDTFCVYPVVLLGDFGLSAPLQVAQTVGIGSYGFTAPVGQAHLWSILDATLLTDSLQEVPLARRPDSHPFKWTTSCDIFSLGATLWNLMSLQTPPDRLSECDSLPELPTCYSPELRNLVLKCYAVNQSSRPKAVEILDECIQRGYWNETLVSPYGTIVSSNFHTALQQSWHDCLEQLNLPRKSTALVNQAPALVDDTLNLMKLGQSEKYGRFSIFIAGEFA
jgi:serine/threonine protein kinase